MEFNLIDQFSQPTEEVNNTPVFEQVSNIEIEEIPEVTDDVVKDKLRDLVDDEDTAEMLIDAYDMLGQFVLPWMYQRALFTAEERTQLKATLEKIKKSKKDTDGKVTITYTEEEQDLLMMNEESEAYERDIVPLSDKEIAAIKKPLIKLIAKIDMNVSPLSALSFVMLMTSVPRLLPVVGAMRDKKKRK